MADENGRRGPIIAAPGGSAPPITVQLDGNRLRVIEEGRDLLETLLELIDGAQHSLKLYYYIFASDRSGQRVLAHLMAAQRRGVRVTLIVDAFGSSRAERGFFEPLRTAGGRFGWFGTRRSTRYLIRNHQKLAIADDARLLIGGFNIADSYFCAPGENGWCDLGLWLEGPEVLAMRRWYARLDRWVMGETQSFRRMRRMVRGWRPGTGRFQWLIGGPTRHLSPWAQRLKKDLERAGRLDMVEAYFSPGEGMLRRLRRVARRGQTRLIFASRSDNGATIGAARLLYGPLLRAGAEIHEYRPCKLHMKLIVIDDAVYIGSANFDMRSLFLNLELMLRIEDAGFAQQMRGLIDRRAAGSEHITRALHEQRRGALTLIKWWISYLLVGVLDYTVTRRLNFRTTDRN